MFSANFAQNHLRECLANVPPVELKGMALLRERPPAAEFFPPLDMPRAVIAEAVTELVAHIGRCGEVARLTPVT